MPVKSKILVVEKKDSGFLNISPGHTCSPKMSKIYDLRVLWFGWFLLKLPKCKMQPQQQIDPKCGGCWGAQLPDAGRNFDESGFLPFRMCVWTNSEKIFQYNLSDENDRRMKNPPQCLITLAKNPMLRKSWTRKRTEIRNWWKPKQYGLVNPILFQFINKQE